MPAKFTYDGATIAIVQSNGKTWRIISRPGLSISIDFLDREKINENSTYRKMISTVNVSSESFRGEIKSRFDKETAYFKAQGYNFDLLDFRPIPFDSDIFLVSISTAKFFTDENNMLCIDGVALSPTFWDRARANNFSDPSGASRFPIFDLTFDDSKNIWINRTAGLNVAVDFTGVESERAGMLIERCNDAWKKQGKENLCYPLPKKYRRPISFNISEELALPSDAKRSETKNESSAQKLEKTGNSKKHVGALLIIIILGIAGFLLITWRYFQKWRK